MPKPFKLVLACLMCLGAALGLIWLVEQVWL